MDALVKNPPSASNLLESMRDIGYSLETALADLIDNSISANAQEVNIYCITNTESPYVTIIDNGWGMNEEDLITAMQHGGVPTQRKRDQKDLGRFGLGLKTASFSQCRSLTVISKKENSPITGLCWDLDFVAEQNDWVMRKLTEKEIQKIPHLSHIEKHGTIVLWEKLDRLLEGEEGDKRSELVNAKLETVRNHLSLVFHRFLDGKLKGLGFKKLSLKLNNLAIESFDPFCRNNPATQQLPEEVVALNGHKVIIQPYILPHHSRLTAAEFDFYQNRSDFISNQGAYVYRNGRLMAWGDWFRLIAKGEATKLARVQIDFDNSLDEEWTIDIKKSRAQPPRQVRERLRQVINQISNTSFRVHKGRGERYFQEIKEPIWERYADRKIGIKYEINKQHPLILALIEKYGLTFEKQINLLLETISSELPIEMIYSDYSSSPRELNQNHLTSKKSLEEEILEIKNVLFPDTPIDKNTIIKILTSKKEYRNSHEEVKRILNNH